MIAALLSLKLDAFLPGDRVTERALLTLELAGLVAGLNPLGDLAGLQRFRVSPVPDLESARWALVILFQSRPYVPF